MADLESSRDGGALYLTLNRPDRKNALSADMRSEMIAQFEIARTDRTVRVVVIRGQGGSFCSGGDVANMGQRTPLEQVEFLQSSRRVIESIANLPKPVIAAVEGAAAGAGFSLALACDLIVASADARFSCAFVRLGLVPDQGSSFFLVRQLGLHRAKRLVFSGEFLGAREAASYGIVSDVWEPAVFESELANTVRVFSSGPTASYGLAKKILNRAFELDLASALETEALGQGLAVSTQDYANGVRTFREGGSRQGGPGFTGR